MSKANLLLKNDVGLVLDITESPLGCTVYDLEGNEISGGGSAGVPSNYGSIKIVNSTGSDATVQIIDAWLPNEVNSPLTAQHGLLATIPSNSEINANALYQTISAGVYGILVGYPNSAPTASDLVNCTASVPEEHTTALIVTDGTIPCSATLTF